MKFFVECIILRYNTPLDLFQVITTIEVKISALNVLV